MGEVSSLGRDCARILPGSVKRMDQNRPRGITIIALLMIVFGLAEVVTGFTHNFFGLHTTQGAVSAYVGATIGALYAMAGFLVLTTRRRAAISAIMLLVLVVIGRISMVVTGLYPVEPFGQAIAITLGTSIAIGFAIYLGLKMSTLA